MGRKRQLLDTHRHSDEVMKRLKREPSGVIRERLLAVSLGLKGDLSLGEIASQMSSSRATIQTWLDAYRAEGIEGLSPSKAPRGLAGALHYGAKKGLRQKLAKGSFRRAEDARVWFGKRYGITLSNSRVATLLGKLGARLVRPRHLGSCDLKRERFSTQLARQLFIALKSQHEDLNWKERPVRIWIAGGSDRRTIAISRAARAHLDRRRSSLWLTAMSQTRMGDARCQSS